jgi:hypothetical protein
VPRRQTRSAESKPMTRRRTPRAATAPRVMTHASGRARFARRGTPVQICAGGGEGCGKEAGWPIGHGSSVVWSRAVRPDVAGCRGGVAVDVNGVLVRSSERVLDAVNERRHVAPEPHACTRTPSGAGDWVCAPCDFRVASTASAATTLRLWSRDVERLRRATEDVPPSPFARSLARSPAKYLSRRDCPRAASA